MCFLGPSGDCYVPMVTPMAFCSGDVSPTFGLGLPSSCQGNLWLLDYRPDTKGNAPSCGPRTCTTDGAPWSCCCESCDPAAVGTMCGACDAASRRPRPRPGPGAQTVGPTTPVYVPGPWVPAERRTLPKGLQLGRLSSVPKTSRPLPHCRPSGLRHRSSQTLGFTPGGFSSSFGAASVCQPPKYWVRNCPSPRHRPASCTPRSCFLSTLGGLSYVPGSFPPLRYLRPGCY